MKQVSSRSKALALSCTYAGCLEICHAEGFAVIGLDDCFPPHDLNPCEDAVWQIGPIAGLLGDGVLDT